ncbi:MAG: adenylate/guanylate cyclase domain-containing protein [Calditrichia bacterium]
MFTDIANFTTIAETLGHRELVRLLNDYLTEMSEIVLKLDGTIDKYIGDAIMAEFGAPLHYPDHATKGCLAALEMQKRLKELSHEWLRTGRPTVATRIGISTGTMIVGNMGSPKKFNYTVIGDEVNLAARLESANKTFGTGIMISEATYHFVKDMMITRPLDRLIVKGKSKPVNVYELISKKGDKLPNLLESILPLYHHGIRYYEEREWENAESAFRKCLRLMPDDGPSSLYLKRVQEFAKNPPPPNWNRVYQMTTK